MSERDWIAELSNYLQQIILRLGEAVDQPRSISELRINPPLALEEAKYFLLGLESGLFSLEAEGYVQSELLPHNFTQGPGQIFALHPPPPRLVRESIFQLATASTLVLERGWRPSQIKIGADDASSYGVDMVVKSVAAEILVCVEIKRSLHELQKFTSDFRQCCKRGEHAKADCAFQQNHGIYEFCVRAQPNYLWVVAPGDDVGFKLSYAGAMIKVEELDTLPSRSHIEFEDHQMRTRSFGSTKSF